MRRPRLRGFSNWSKVIHQASNSTKQKDAEPVKDHIILLLGVSVLK